MSIKVVDYAGKATTGTFKIPEHKTLPAATVATVLRAVTANADRQQPLTKTRANVRGGGRKPWRQKGTGRARAGTIRSPLWRGGGVTFGPIGQTRAYRNINRNVRQAALATLLAARAEGGRLVVVKGTANLGKTKDAAALFGSLGWSGRALFVATTDELPDVVGVRNLAAAEFTSSDDLNLGDLGRAGGVVFTEAAFNQMTNKPTPKAAPKASEPKSPKPAAQPASSQAAKPVKPAAKPTPKPPANPTPS